MKIDSANMKIASIFVVCAVFLVSIEAQTTSSNGTRKLQISENSNPQVSYGIAFDEITVESNLNIRGKPAGSSRSQRTQLFPVKQSNNTNNAKANENKSNDIKLANA